MPLARWRIDTNAGIGIFISVRSRYLGRLFLINGRSSSLGNCGKAASQPGTCRNSARATATEQRHRTITLHGGTIQPLRCASTRVCCDPACASGRRSMRAGWLQSLWIIAAGVRFHKGPNGRLGPTVSFEHPCDGAGQAVRTLPVHGHAAPACLPATLRQACGNTHATFRQPGQLRQDPAADTGTQARGHAWAPARQQARPGRPASRTRRVPVSRIRASPRISVHSKSKGASR
jgi:hypothetical protein